MWTTGQVLMDKLNMLIKSYQMEDIFSLGGYPVWSFLLIKDKEPFKDNELKTLMMQVFFENGILCLGTHNISYAHSLGDIDKLMDVYGKFFQKVKEGLSQNSLKDILIAKPLAPLFKVR